MKGQEDLGAKKKRDSEALGLVSWTSPLGVQLGSEALFLWVACMARKKAEHRA